MSKSNLFELDALEIDLLRRFHIKYRSLDFPPPELFEVTSRISSSAGRYTYLSHLGFARIPDGSLGLGMFSQIDIPSLEAGASFGNYILDLAEAIA